MKFTKTQAKRTTAKLRRTRHLSLRLFLAAMISFWYSVSVYISVPAQNLTLEKLACSESELARYACFKKGRKGEFELSKEMEAIRRSARDRKEEFLLVSLIHSKRQCEKLSSGNYAANQVFTFTKYFSKMRNILPYLRLYG